MPLIDLTHTFGSPMPVFPGDPPATLTEIASVREDGFSNHLLSCGMHTGTHMDAPMHFIDSGLNISELGLSRLIGPAILLDARGQQQLQLSLLDGVTVRRELAVLILTGHDKHFGKPEYYQAYPLITPELGRKLTDSGVRLLGLDTPSPDDSPFAIHQQLLGAGIPIIENLTGLELLLDSGEFELMALPLKVEAGGAPVRVVARL
ncbi:cyclase family protein [Dongshaea marina]|uniref:cyclase family protein n=1 Tax=Dongshaea marina TaxID=2047966 RepID=UPI000D3E93EB|nr:cyclase family protein [Dongshaea marina]